MFLGGYVTLRCECMFSACFKPLKKQTKMLITYYRVQIQVGKDTQLILLSVSILLNPLGI